MSQCKEEVTSKTLPRVVVDKYDEDIFTRDGESEIPRNSKQITNFKQSQKRSNDPGDDVLNILTNMMNSRESKRGCWQLIKINRSFGS